MRTVRCSDRLLGGVCRGGGVCPGGMSAWGCVYPSMHWGGHPPVNRMTDWQVLKHYLSSTSFADGKIQERIPVGRVPPSCWLYMWWLPLGVSPKGWVPPSGPCLGDGYMGAHPLIYPPEEWTCDHAYPPPERTWDQGYHPSSLWTDRHLWHYFLQTSLAGSTL